MNNKYHNNNNFAASTQYADTYEPNKNVKESYLLLRKNEFSCVSLRLPGLFSYRKGHDKFMFRIGFLFESLATLLIWVLASAKFNSAIMAILIGLGCVVVLDYILCWVHQNTVVKRTSEKNNKKILLIKSLHGEHLGYSTYVNTLENTLPNYDITDFIFKGLIWVLVSIRALGFVSLAQGSKIFYFFAKSSGSMAYSGLLLICLMYFWIGWIHTHYTGYALAGWWHSWLKTWDRKFFYRNMDGKQHSPFTMQKTIDIRKFVNELRNDPDQKCRFILRNYDDNNLEEDIKKGFTADADWLNQNQGTRHTSHYPHQILAVNGSDGERCIVKSNGFFDDNSLYRMISQQETDIAKYAVALHGIAMQLEFLDYETRHAD